MVNSKMRFNNDSFIIGNVGANLPGGLMRFGRNSCQGTKELTPCVGNSVAVSADRVVIGELSSIAGSECNRLKLGPGAQVRNSPLFSVSLPLVSNDPTLVCGAFADVNCGGPDVSVPELGSQVIPPGSYNGLLVGNGATITLGAGAYNFCSVKIGSNVQGNMDEATVLNVVGKFSVGSGTTLETGGAPFALNSEGRLVRLSQAAVIEAEVRAPFGKIKQQRNAVIRGCSCSDSLTADKNHPNICQTGSPSGAFVD